MNPEPPALPHGAGSPLGYGERDDDAAEGSPLELEEILTAIRETAYRWDFATDRIDWAANAETVLGVADPERSARHAPLRSWSIRSMPARAMTGSPAVRMPRPGPSCAIASAIASFPRDAAAAPRCGSRTRGVCSIDAEARPRLAQGTLRIIDNRRHDQEERLLYLGNHDELTGQFNRTRLTEELTRFLGTAGRTPAKGAFLLAGVNDLTLINETYGYDVGDEVITIVGRRIGHALRGRDCIGRFSSNKFGIVLQDCGVEGAEVIARRIMAAVRDSVIDTSVGAVATSLSVGAVLLPQHAGNSQAAIARALQALDLARHSHSDRLTLYQHCERRDSERRRSVAIADEVVRALNDRRMILALQPIVTSRSHEPELYECLLRMKRLDGTIASASEFIPVAEQFGLAKLVDHRASSWPSSFYIRRRTSSSRSTSRPRPPPTRNGCMGWRLISTRRRVLPKGSPSRSPRRPPSPICRRPPNSWRRSRRSAAAWRWTISAPAIPRSGTCGCSASTWSRSTAPSSRISAPRPRTSCSCAR